MSTKTIIIDEMKKIAHEHNTVLANLDDDTLLLESGLDSLGFAILVARLEGTLGVDPFTDAAETEFPITLGDLVRAYSSAVPPSSDN